MIRITLEDGMNRLEEGIAKAMMIMDGYPASALFSSEEYMKYYEYPFLLAGTLLDVHWNICFFFF